MSLMCNLCIQRWLMIKSKDWRGIELFMLNWRSMYACMYIIAMKLHNLACNGWIVMNWALKYTCKHGFIDFHVYEHHWCYLKWKWGQKSTCMFDYGRYEACVKFECMSLEFTKKCRLIWMNWIMILSNWPHLAYMLILYNVFACFGTKFMGFKPWKVGFERKNTFWKTQNSWSPLERGNRCSSVKYELPELFAGIDVRSSG